MKWCCILLAVLFFTISPLQGGETYLRYQQLLKFKNTYYEGKSFFTSGEYKEALIYFLDLLDNAKLLPKKALRFVHYYTGESFFQLDLYAQALTNFSWLVKHPPIPYKNMVFKRIMEIYYIQNKYKKFKSMFPEAVSSAPGFESEFNYLLGRILLEEQSYTKAIQKFKTVSTKSKWYKRAQYFLGYAYTGAGKITEAVSTWKKVLATGFRRDELLLNLGILAKKLHRFSDAENYFSAITEGSPDRENALYDLAWTEIDQNKLNKALSILKTLAYEFPRSQKLGEVGLLIGYIYLSLKHFKEAYQYFSENQKIFKELEKNMNFFWQVHGLPEEFYVALKHPSPQSVSLPTVIRNWILENQMVATASQYIEETKNIRLQIEEIKYRIHDIALKALSPENEFRSPAHLDLLTLQGVRDDLIRLLNILLQLKAAPIKPYMFKEEKLILNRITLLRENLLELRNSPQKLLKIINKKRKDIENLRNYLLTINPGIIEGKSSITTKEGLKIEIPYAREVMEKFYLEINNLTQVSLDLFSLKYWIKNAIDYTFILQDRMLDIILFRLGIYGDKRYTFFIKASNIFNDGWGILHTISGVEEAIAKIEKKNFMRFYAHAVTQERNLNYLLAMLNQIGSDLERVRGGLAMEQFKKIKDKIHGTVVDLQLGKINVVWKAKEEDEKLAKTLLDKKEALKEKIFKHYQWVVQPTREPPPQKLINNDIKDYLKMLSVAEKSKGNQIYIEQLKNLGDMVAQLIGQYYKVQEVIKRMETLPLK